MAAHVRSESRFLAAGKSAKGESVTSVGKPGESVSGKPAGPGKTGKAKGGAGGSASAKGGSASAGSVEIQTSADR